jgi:hypothetical protein
LGEVLLIGREIVFGQNDGLAGEAVAESVEGRSTFALLGTRAGGAGGVAAVDGGSGFFKSGCGWMWIHGDTSICFSPVGKERGGGLERELFERVGVGVKAGA